MQQNYPQRENHPAYSNVPSLQSPNFTESNLFSSYNSDSPCRNHVIPYLPFLLRETKLSSKEDPLCPLSNPFGALYQTEQSQASTDNTNTPTESPAESPSLTQMGSSEIRGIKSENGFSIDDADVLLAAEALGDLRAGSPPQQSRVLPKSPRTMHEQRNQQQEPLLSLLSISHPLIGNAIGGSLSAYSASKRYSPRFKSSAEYVERRFTPVVNTVGSVGRITGVEGGMRWILGGRNSRHSLTQPDKCAKPSNKRRKLDEDVEMDGNSVNDTDSGRRRQLSQSSTADSLPVYDELRNSSYEFRQALVTTKAKEDPNLTGFSWQSRLALSTSGLSIAMSEESLRSLKYCLSWLRWANQHIGKVFMTLKATLEQYDSAYRIENSTENGDRQFIAQSEAERHALSEKIEELKKDVLKTLKEVVDIVSKYAGGALPENARILVRRHLTSLPRRFRLATSKPTEGSRNSDGADVKLVEGGHRILVLAKEGLDMMAQVSGVLDSTIISAEEWCQRLGRSMREKRQNGCNDMEIAEKPPTEFSKSDPNKPLESTISA